MIVGAIVAAIIGAVSDAPRAFWSGSRVYLVLPWSPGSTTGYLVGAKGQSPGMALMGLRCIGEETGQVIGGGMGVVRTIAHIVDSIICYIGWLFPLWDAKRQTIADKLVKTLVVAVRRSSPSASISSSRSPAILEHESASLIRRRHERHLTGTRLVAGLRRQVVSA